MCMGYYYTLFDDIAYYYLNFVVLYFIVTNKFDNLELQKNLCPLQYFFTRNKQLKGEAEIKF
jgi:hypothetical protein